MVRSALHRKAESFAHVAWTRNGETAAGKERQEEEGEVRGEENDEEREEGDVDK